MIDLYCIYNRARGTDMISPMDLKTACVLLNTNSSKFYVKRYASGVLTIQSRKSYPLSHFVIKANLTKRATSKKLQKR